MATPISRRRVVLTGLAASVGAALPASITGCCPCNIKSSYTWNNALRIDGIDPQRVAEPGSLPELVDLVVNAESAGQRIRMVGSGHSFSDVAKTAGVLLLPTRLSRLLVLDRSQLRAECRDDRSLFRMQSGTTIRSANGLLDAQGFSLQNLGGYDGQTIVGAASTGTHGSGLDYGPIASQIVSMQVVVAGGRVLQVEPNGGITDPNTFVSRQSIGGRTIDIELVQDDEIWNALSVSFGCMGVVYAVVVRTEPKYWLKEVRQLTSWGALTTAGGFLDRLLRGEPRIEPNAAVDPAYYEIYVNPYPPKGSSGAHSHRCILTKRYKLSEKPQRLSREDRKRGRYGADFVRALAQVTGKGEAVMSYLNAHPQAAPGVIDDSLASLEDSSYIDVSYNVFNLGPPNLIRAYGIEVGFDLQQSVTVTQRLFEIAQELRAEGTMHNTPPSLRFVKGSNAHLAMMQGRDTMMLEMGMLVCANKSDELLRTYETHFREELGGRPHWGLDLNTLSSFEQVRRLYPRTADRWLAVYQRLNDRGTFNGPVTDRLGISVGL